jgi:hypothetical protein
MFAAPAPARSVLPWWLQVLRLDVVRRSRDRPRSAGSTWVRRSWSPGSQACAGLVACAGRPEPTRLRGQGGALTERKLGVRRRADASNMAFDSFAVALPPEAAPAAARAHLHALLGLGGNGPAQAGEHVCDGDGGLLALGKQLSLGVDQHLEQREQPGDQ